MPSDGGVAAALTIADLRVVVADIPVRRPHHMSFTTLEAVNFVFVRLETREGHVGWGEAACLGGPTCKVTKSAGILGALAVARVAEAAGLGGYVGCMIETSLGTAAYLAVALTAPPVTWGCELFGPLLLAGDVVRQPVRYEDGAILALDEPGLGVEVDEAALRSWARRA
jgi:muconate cycloisomerase